MKFWCYATEGGDRRAVDINKLKEGALKEGDNHVEGNGKDTVEDASKGDCTL